MDTTFMNSENSKTSDSHVASLDLPMYYIWKNIKTSYKKNQLKISAPTWNEKLELPDGSCK